MRSVQAMLFELLLRPHTRQFHRLPLKLLDKIQQSLAAYFAAAQLDRTEIPAADQVIDHEHFAKNYRPNFSQGLFVSFMLGQSVVSYTR